MIELIQYIALISFKNIDSIDTLEESIITQFEFCFKNASIIKTFNNDTKSLTTFIKETDSILISNKNLNLSKGQVDFIVGGFIKIIYDIRFNNLLIDEVILNQYKNIIHSILTKKVRVTGG